MASSLFFAQKHLRFFTQSFPLCFSHPKFQTKSTGATKRSLITFHESSWLFNWDSYFHGIGFFPLQQKGRPSDHPNNQGPFSHRTHSNLFHVDQAVSHQRWYTATQIRGTPGDLSCWRFFGSPEIPPKTEAGGWHLD